MTSITLIIRPYRHVTNNICTLTIPATNIELNASSKNVCPSEDRHNERKDLVQQGRSQQLLVPANIHFSGRSTQAESFEAPTRNVI